MYNIQFNSSILKILSKKGLYYLKILYNKHGGKKNEQMEWFIGGVLVLIIGIVSFIMTNNYHTLIAPVILFLYGVYRLVFVK